jgi:hypothetical protein
MLSVRAGAMLIFISLNRHLQVLISCVFNSVPPLRQTLPAFESRRNQMRFNLARMTHWLP